jgi:hypothetical protein
MSNLTMLEQLKQFGSAFVSMVTHTGKAYEVSTAKLVDHAKYYKEVHTKHHAAKVAELDAAKYYKELHTKHHAAKVAELDAATAALPQEVQDLIKRFRAKDSEHNGMPNFMKRINEQYESTQKKESESSKTKVYRTKTGDKITDPKAYYSAVNKNKEKESKSSKTKVYRTKTGDKITNPKAYYSTVNKNKKK